MRKIEAVEIEADDVAYGEPKPAARSAMDWTEIVTYRGEVVKNRNGRITRKLSEMLSEKRAEDEGETRKTRGPSLAQRCAAHLVQMFWPSEWAMQVLGTHPVKPQFRYFSRK